MLRGGLALLLAAMAWGLPAPGLARAQAPPEPLELRPLPGTVLTVPPTEVRLRFAAPLATPLASYNFIVVYDRHSERVDLGPADHYQGTPPSPEVLATRLGPLNPGIYTVRWRATAGIGERSADGSYSFAVAPRLGSSTWVPLLAIGIAGVLAGMALGAWMARLRQRGPPPS